METAKMFDLSIRMNFARPESMVEYRMDGDLDWSPTVYQSSHFTTIDHALEAVDAWLEECNN